MGEESARPSYLSRGGSKKSSRRFCRNNEDMDPAMIADIYPRLTKNNIESALEYYKKIRVIIQANELKEEIRGYNSD